MPQESQFDPTHAVFNQAQPLQDYNAYLGDSALREAIAHEGAADCYIRISQTADRPARLI